MYKFINLTGGTYRHNSLPVSAQSTINFYPQFVEDPFVKDKYVLESFAGQTLFGTTTGIGRGQFVHKGILYRISGNTLYSVTSAGVHTSLGSIPGSQQCIFTGLGADVVIVADRRVFIWDGATLTEVTDVDLQSPDSATTLNNQVIYDGDNDQFGVSDVGDASSIDGLNYATAESKPDDLIRVYAFNQFLYLFGDETIEQWWNSGIGKPPFDRVQGAIIERGLEGIHGVSNNDNFIYFFSDKKELLRLKGSTQISVTPEAIQKEFSDYSSTSDVIIWCMKLRGKEMVAVVFPVANRSWIYIEDGQWFEWSSGVTGDRNKANSYAFVYDKHLVEDFENGNIYELDFEVYTENGDTIVRQRDSGPLDSQVLFGITNKRIFMNRLVVNLERGVGVLAGQGIKPVIMMSFSDDGGRTFSNEKWAEIGRLGDFQFGVEYNCLGSFFTRIIRIRVSDPVYYNITSVGVDVELGI